MNDVIAYYRVSTKRQGKSGLGLEAQQIAVEDYIKRNGLLLIDQVVEVQSTKKDRNGLQKALNLCKKRKAKLIVAKLDRLGRDVEEIARIVKSKVGIIVTDNPHANLFTIHILAAVAQEQRQRIGDTTREALSAAKRRGRILGKQGKVLSAVNKKAAQEFAKKLIPVLERMRDRGIVTVRAIAKELNKKKILTYRKRGKWHPTTVHNLLCRVNAGDRKQ